jgi:hypothetical protein
MANFIISVMNILSLYPQSPSQSKHYAVKLLTDSVNFFKISYKQMTIPESTDGVK